MKRHADLDEAYEAGRNADFGTKNPYVPTSLLAVQWSHGYRDAMRYRSSSESSFTSIARAVLVTMLVVTACAAARAFLQ